MLNPILPNIPGLSEQEARDQGRLSDVQEATIRAVLAEPTKAALIASETGFGKTVITSEVAIRAGWKRVLIIIVGKTFGQWEGRLAAQSGGAIQLRRMDSTKPGLAAWEDFVAGEEGYFAATISWLNQRDVEYRDKTVNGHTVPLLDKKTGLPTGKNERVTVRLKTFSKLSDRKKGPVEALIFDESHQTASRKSEMRKALIMIRAEWKIALSATWAGNDLSEHGWATPRWLWPDLVPAYWTWRGIYFNEVPKQGSDGKPVYLRGRAMTVAREKNPGEFVRSLPLYMRGENPEKAPPAFKIFVEPSPEQAGQYADLKEELLSWVLNYEGEREPLVVDIPAVLRTRLRQVALAELSIDADGSVAFAPDAVSAKLRALKGILDAWNGQPVVLMTDSRKFAQLTARRMTAAGYRAEAWVGGLSERETERIKTEYLAGDLKYIVLTVQAGGTGLDFFQVKSSKIVWLSLPDGDPKLEEQALGRVFRNGMTKQYGDFAHVRLMMNGSLDVEVLDNLLAKGKLMRASIGASALKIA